MMQAIRLYTWDDKDKQRPLREVRVLRADDLTRNGKQRIFIWSEDDEFNYMIYPQFGTAYPEYESRLQHQRIARRYLYEQVD